MRYFFNERNDDLKVDDDGLELASIKEARIEAVRYAGEVLRDHPTLVWTGDDFRIEVTDKTKLLLFTIIVVGVDAPAGRDLARHAAVLQAG